MSIWGYTQSFASVYRQGKLIVWDTPIISSSNSLEITQVLISPDGLFWFSSLESFTFFTLPTFTGVDNLQISPSGKYYITDFGTNFYNSSNILGYRMKLTEMNTLTCKLVISKIQRSGDKSQLNALY